MMTLFIGIYNKLTTSMYNQSFKSVEFGNSAYPLAAIQTLVTILATSIIFGVVYAQKLKKVYYLMIALLWTAVFMI